jgi:hypothetical protein
MGVNRDYPGVRPAVPRQRRRATADARRLKHAPTS